MSNWRQAAEAALEALEGKRFTACGWRSDCDKAITALKAALADGDNLSPTEPVAWMWEETAPRSSTGIGGIDRKLLFCRPADEPWKRNITPLYTAPPQRKPLTEEEIGECLPMGIAPYSTVVGRREIMRFARAIEQAHGIKEAGCDHCNHPLYAAIKCRQCGRVTE